MLDYRLGGLNIAEVLDLPVAQAAEFFGGGALFLVGIGALGLVQQLGINADGALLRRSVGKIFGVDVAHAVDGAGLGFFLARAVGPSPLALRRQRGGRCHVFREDFINLGFRYLFHFGFAAEMAVEHFSDVGIVADDNQHRGDAILTQRRLLNVLEPFHPLTGDLQQSALRLAVHHVRPGFPRPAGQ